ncbi:transposase [Candidatus Peregrinibacteria bacterium]|nr:MAG: transposase [Candidatus Peregrinibacteria bacterium]
MNKYIQDFITNKCRSIFTGLTLPQKKALAEVLRGLFVEATPILRHLAQNKEVSAKKQGNKYSHHLGNVDLQKKVEDFSVRAVASEIRKNTVIAYDLVDLSKPSAKKMEKLSQVYDSSEGSIEPGFLLHGVGVNNLLLKLRFHHNDKEFLGQVRKAILEELTQVFDHKGIFVFDRGNDDEKLFRDLRQVLKVQFIARVRENRTVVLKETGVLISVKELPEGSYEVFFDEKWKSAWGSLPQSAHTEPSGRKEPIRLIYSLKDSYTAEQIVNLYLERWGIEKSFKRVKQKFQLEKIRVLSLKKFINLIALTQFAMNLSVLMFRKVQALTHSLVTSVVSNYKGFIAKKSLTFNLESFITFLQNSLQSLQFHAPPKRQPSLFSFRQLKKLGSF